MAKILPYTDPQTGTVYPDATWVPAEPNVNFLDPNAPYGRITWFCYPTPELAAQHLGYSLGLPGVKKPQYGRILSADRLYALTPDEIRGMFRRVVSGGLFGNIMAEVCYDIEAGRLIGNPPADGEDDTRQTFFADAKDVDLLAI